MEKLESKNLDLDLKNKIKQIDKQLTEKQRKLFYAWLNKELLLLQNNFGDRETQEKNLKIKLKLILNDLNLLDDYKLQTENEYVKQLYKIQLNKLKASILEFKNKATLAPLYVLLINLISNFKFEKTSNPVLTFTLDKKFSLDDRQIVLLNYLNYNVNAQLFIVDKGFSGKILILKLSNGQLMKLNIDNYKIYKTKSHLVLMFLKDGKYNLLLNYKGKLYLLKPIKDNIFVNFSLLEKIQFILHGYDDEIVKKLIKTLPKEEIKISSEKEKHKSKSSQNSIKTNENVKEQVKNTYVNILNKQLAENPVLKRKEIIKKFLDSPEMNEYYNLALSTLQNKGVIVNKQKITFSKDFINNHKAKLLSNFKTFLLFIFSVESDFNPLNKPSGSSAQGLAQWLVKDGKVQTDKNGKKYRGTSSWETTLNLIIRNYHQKTNYEKLIQPILPVKHVISSRLTPNITDETDSKLTPKQYPDALSWKEQIKILTLALPLKGSKFFMLALLGNEWGFKNYYKHIHNTKPDEATNKRIRQRFPIYKKQLYIFLPSKSTWMEYTKYLRRK